MRKSYRKFLSFQSGEVSPRYLGRSDEEIYLKGLAKAENVMIDKRGGAYKRRGLLHKTRITGNVGRIFTIQSTRTRFYTVAIHDLEMIVSAPGAGILGSNLLTNSNFGQGAASWTPVTDPASSQVTFISGLATLTPEQNDPSHIVNGDFNQSGTNWIVRESAAGSIVTFTGTSVTLEPRLGGGGAEYAGVAQQILTGNAGIVHDFVTNANFSGNNLRVRIGTVEADGAYLDTIIDESSAPLSFTPLLVPYFITIDCEKPDPIVEILDLDVTERIVKTAAITQMATVTAAITDLHVVIVQQLAGHEITVKIGTAQGLSDILLVTSNSAEITATFVPNAATYWVEVEADGNKTDNAKLTFLGSAKDIVGVTDRILMPAPWTESQLDEIHIVESPEGKFFYFTHPNVPVYKLFYNPETDTFIPLAQVAFTNPVPEWTGTNHPSTGTFYQGRLWFGGTPGQQQTFWGSFSGDYEDFAFDDGGGPPVITDANAVRFTLREFGRIEWMLGTKTLLLGTEIGEHIVTSEGPVITPSDFKIEQQSSFGSNNMQGTQVAEKVFYLTPDGRKLRAMAYEWQEDNWMSLDLTFASEHITAGVGKHSAWAQHPNNLFIIAMDDGGAAVLTYDRSAKTVAWTSLVMDGFKIIDVTTGTVNGVSELVLLGQRVPGFLDVESSVGDFIDVVDNEAAQYLDSYVGKFDEAGTNVIDGLDHLEGELVRALVDGSVEHNHVVVGGQITTEITGKQLYAGKGYSGLIKTLPPDVQGGQIRSFAKRWNKVWALMVNSKQPLINGTRPPDRTPATPMDTVEPDVTDHFKTVNLGWDDFGQITVEQDLPVAMNLLAIYGELDDETL